MAEAAEIGKCLRRASGARNCRLSRVFFRALWQLGNQLRHFAFGPGRGPCGCGHCLATPLAMANLATLSPFAASTMSNMSDSPEVRKDVLDLDSHLLGRFARRLDTLGRLL